MKHLADNEKKYTYGKEIFLFLLFIFSTFAISASAQSATLSGNITAANGKAIAHAILTVYESGRGVAADSAGRYSLPHAAGKFTVMVSSLGYKSKKQAVAFLKGKEIALDFILEDDPAYLEEVKIFGQRSDGNGLRRLADIENMAIYAGKKNEVLILNDINANLATNNSRQIYAKVPGINIIESDAAGVQLGIAARGLNPNRTTSFNTRQNGYDISADPIGYPESYYTPPTEAIDRIEIVRGAASLQYGTQFGGLLNFQFKKGPDKKIELVSRQTAGSYGMFNSFHSLGGQAGKWNYYAFYTHKQGDGWRENTNFNVNVGYFSATYQISSRLKIGTELTLMSSLMKQPGGLTDSQFEENPRASYRQRNRFQVKWNMPALTLDYQLGQRTQLNIRSYGLIAERGSIGNSIDLLKDPQDTTQRRQLTYDYYKNFGAEARILHRYALFNKKASVLIGARYYKGNTHRIQGTGFNGADANFNFPNAKKVDEFDYRFPSYNAAFFVENVIWINEKISVTPGFRYEYINTNARGYSHDPTTNSDAPYAQQNVRNFPLVGIGINVVAATEIEIYGNISQNYSPVSYSDILQRSPAFKVDPNLKDVIGFNADVGCRGKYKTWLNFDISLYYLAYNNRVGIIRAASDDGLDVIRYRTNIGRSRSQGVESFAEINLTRLVKKNSSGNLSLFGSAAYTDAAYTSALDKLLTALLVNKQVEYAPKYITRTGLTWQKKGFSTTFQYAYTSQQFTDAYNSPPTADGLAGPIKAYGLLDWSANYTFKKLLFGLTINNLTNRYYFTRRALGFPGPGIIPADARGFFLTVGIKI